MKRWHKWAAILVVSAAVARYWHLYSKHLDTARLVSVQMCLIDGEQLAQVDDELVAVLSRQLVARKLAGDSFIERAALKRAIIDGLTCEPLGFL
ncbi:hypothetical protein [Thalassomonas sp. RHCl1]|uniref:hypothetical protein n=1 Tax=Thalassomonas sp. RHCl1 TaxID=2995320 RepID=UPI00248C8D53|nr:hypothetical protein [Thalassomonas sp. RHCl1]